MTKSNFCGGRGLFQRIVEVYERMLLAGLLSLLSYTTQDYLPKGGTTHIQLGLPESVKTITPRLAYRLVLQSHVLKIPPFQLCLNLCQVDKKPTKTVVLVRRDLATTSLG